MILHMVTSLLGGGPFVQFPKDCIMKLHYAGPPGGPWRGIRVGSCHSCLHYPHVIEVSPSLTSISLCNRVDLGRPLPMRCIESSGTIVGPP